MVGGIDFRADVDTGLDQLVFGRILLLRGCLDGQYVQCFFADLEIRNGFDG